MHLYISFKTAIIIALLGLAYVNSNLLFTQLLFKYLNFLVFQKSRPFDVGKTLVLEVGLSVYKERKLDTLFEIR